MLKTSPSKNLAKKNESATKKSKALTEPNIINKATNINNIYFDPDMHQDNATESMR